jgi:hypothetical protein
VEEGSLIKDFCRAPWGNLKTIFKKFTQSYIRVQPSAATDSFYVALGANGGDREDTLYRKPFLELPVEKGGFPRSATGKLPHTAKAASCRCPARGGDEDIDLLANERRKLTWREFVDRLQHAYIHPLGRLSRQ